MGIYLNPGNDGFCSIRNGIYVDKTGLIAYVNKTLGTSDKLTCVSRPRRFGKSFAAKMLCAYYDKSCDSKALFEDLVIGKNENFEKYLNKYDVLYLDITSFISTCPERKKLVRYIQKLVLTELHSCFPEITPLEETLPMMLSAINEATGKKFIIIIDEWDALIRESKEDLQLQEEYIQLLRGLFKDSGKTDKMIEAAYMTGILPIKKYGTQSAMTDFREYTMLRPKKMAEFMGFTEMEVIKLCEEYQMDFDSMKMWYDGYSFNRLKSIYSPNSVMEAVKNEEFGTYWTETETYESLKNYINADFDGLKATIIEMLAGVDCKIAARKFQNDLVNIKSKDDVLTLLVHLGYLAYDQNAERVSIPNLEVAEEFQNAVEDSGWENISKALKNSEQLLEDTLAGNAGKVAQALDACHMENTSIIAYNDENALSAVISIAYFYAKKDYRIQREAPAGKGFADLIFCPRKNSDKPAFIVELKWDKTVEGAISQIKEKNYPLALEDYTGKILLVGVNYSKKDKIHECVIETMKKE